MPTSLSLRLATLALGLAALAGCSEDTPTTPVASLAVANVPLHFTEHADTSFSISCGTFDITVVGTFYDVRETVFLDPDGDPLRSRGLVRASLLVTNVSTGETVADRSAMHYEVDFRTGVIVNDGKFFNLKDGIPVRDIGRFVFNEETGEILFEGGHHDVGLDPNPLNTYFCQVLA